jgi:peptidoglycan/xylan/chitin deacetylase (PgdA/CDA1 family)
MTEGRLAVSVDVEDWYHVPAVTGSSFSEYDDVGEFLSEWNDEYDYLTEPTHRTLDLLDNFGITATFFIVADVVDHYPGLIKSIAERGHEIACHGLHHECTIDPDTKKPRFSREEYANHLLRAKQKLEAASGKKVSGYRAPGAYIAGWVIDVLEEVGFNYDSSVARNSLYNKTDQKLDEIETIPYTPKRGTLTPGGDRDVIEIPWPYYDVKIGKIPTAGGPLLRLFGRRIIQAGIEQSLQRGDSVFYFHPIDISRRSFPSVGNTRRRPAYWLFKGKRTEDRISTLLSAIPSSRLITCSSIHNRTQAS